MKAYIYYKGGQYGDLVFSLINNGVHLPNWVQAKLKNNTSHNDADFKHFVKQLPLNVITGCASFPLDWGVENYELVCTDQDICAFTVTRLLELNHNVDLKEVLKFYYQQEMSAYIDTMSVEQIKQLMIKKYQASVTNPKIKSSNLITLNQIYNKEKFIDLLASYFEFDTELAKLQYDQWYERELPLLNKFFKSV
jgi:hypothetical protein